MKTFSERLRYALELAHCSQSELARRIGLKAQAIQYLADPKNNAQGSRHIHQIAKALGVHAEWLVTGKGKIRSNWPMYDNEIIGVKEDSGCLSQSNKNTDQHLTEEELKHLKLLRRLTDKEKEQLKRIIEALMPKEE